MMENSDSSLLLLSLFSIVNSSCIILDSSRIILDSSRRRLISRRRARGVLLHIVTAAPTVSLEE